MSYIDDLDKKFKERGGKDTCKGLFVRIEEDIKLAVQQICVEKGWYISNIVDHLLEQFINDYRQFWPEDGMFQTQIEMHTDEESEDVKSEESKEERVPPIIMKHPDYFSIAFPFVNKLRYAIKGSNWDYEAEEQLRKIANETQDEWVRNRITKLLQNWNQHKKQLEKNDEVIET